MYLATVIDIGKRGVVGWSMSDSLSKELVIDALDMAWKRERPTSSILFHSDRGCQYASKAFRRRVKRYNMVQSMSRKGNCWDNAVAESFFHTLKIESFSSKIMLSKRQMRLHIFAYIEMFYNTKRMHSALGYKSPACYERELLQQCA